jgi:hypothetical protein
MSVSGMAHVNGPVRARGPYPFDLQNLNRLIGRGGRIADTSDPVRYAAVLRTLLRQYGIPHVMRRPLAVQIRPSFLKAQRARPSARPTPRPCAEAWP